MSLNLLYQKEINNLRKGGLHLNPLDLKVTHSYKGYQFVIRIEERYYNNLLRLRLEKLGYSKSNRFDSQSVPLNVNDVIKAQSRGKVLNSLNKTIHYVVFERFLAREDL